MIYDHVHIPLGKELKTGSFRKDHPEHGMSLFQTAFLAALHRVTIVNAGTLHTVHAGFQCGWAAEFGTSVSQDIFECRNEFISSHTFFQTVKNKAYSTFCTAVHKKCEKKPLSCKKQGQEGFL